MATATATENQEIKNNKNNNKNNHSVGDWYSVPDLSLRDHRFAVPLDHSVSSSSSSINISVFAREVVQAGKEEKNLPYLLYLQGGPGFESPRPAEASGWLKKACEDYRVILLDQRGTGLSTPLTASSLSQLTPAVKMVDFLKHFRADNIVKDAEFIRKSVVPDAGPWTVLGQSYGGFCAVTYLSFAPEGLKSVLLTGGLPPIGKDCIADTVYRACFEQVIHQNEKYYKRFPQDISVVIEVVKYLAGSEGGGVPLPSGGILTPKGLQLLGLAGLGSGGGFERLHYMPTIAYDQQGLVFAVAMEGSAIKLFDSRSYDKGLFDTFLVGGDTTEVYDIKFTNGSKSMLLMATNNYMLDAHAREKESVGVTNSSHLQLGWSTMTASALSTMPWSDRVGR